MSGRVLLQVKRAPKKQLELDYQVSICSLIPPATAISKTQDRADTKGNNSKSRKTRVTVHVFCTSSYRQRLCIVS